MKKKILSLVLALAMVLSLFPGMSTPASADSAMNIRNEIWLAKGGNANEYFVQGLIDNTQLEKAYAKTFASEGTAKAACDEYCAIPKGEEAKCFSNWADWTEYDKETDANLPVTAKEGDTHLVLCGWDYTWHYYAIIPLDGAAKTCVPILKAGATVVPDNYWLDVRGEVHNNTEESYTDNYAYYKNGVLTMKNFTFGADFLSFDKYWDDRNTYSPKIHLIGTNTLTQVSTAHNLEITGEGASLTLSGPISIWKGNTLTISGTTLDIATDQDNGITEDGGSANVIINDSNVTITAKTNAVKLTGTFTVQGSSNVDLKVTGTRTQYALGVDGSKISFDPNLGVIASTVIDGTFVDYVTAQNKTYKHIKIGNFIKDLSSKVNFDQDTGKVTITDFPGYYKEVDAGQVEPLMALAGQPVGTAVLASYFSDDDSISGGMTVNVNAGQSLTFAIATADGNGKITGIYAGTYSAPFNLRDAQVVVTGDYTYDGEEKKPTVTVTLDGTPLTQDVDYTLSYSNNINACNFNSENAPTVTVTAIENSGYTGTVSQTFTINAWALDENEITATVPYVKKDGDNLTLADDYSVKCGDVDLKSYIETPNISIDPETGKASVQFDFSGNYTGSKTVSDIPVKFVLNADMFNKIDDQTYTGSALKPDVEISDAGEEAGLTTDDFDVTYSENTTNVGEVTVTINAKGDKFTGSVPVSYKIVAKTLDPDNITVDGVAAQSYTGSAIELPELVVKYDDVEMEKVKDYTVSYVNNEDVGTATITIHFSGNYDCADVEQRFEILPIDLVDDNDNLICKDTSTFAFVDEVFQSTIKYGDKTLNQGLLSEGADYEVTEKDFGERTAKIKFSDNYGGDEYEIKGVPVKIRIQNWFTVTENKKTYNGKVQNVTVALKGDAPVGFGADDFKIIYKLNDVEVEPKNVIDRTYYRVYAVAIGSDYFGEIGIGNMYIYQRGVDIKVKDLAVTAGAGLPNFEYVLIDGRTGEEINDDTVSFTEKPVFTILDENGESIKDAEGKDIAGLDEIWNAINSKAGTYMIHCSNWKSIKLGGDGAGNYSLSKSKDNQNATLTIKKAAAPNYTITISDGNGNTTAVSVTKGDTYTLPECTFTAPEGKQFKAWNVNGTEMNPGDTITVTDNMTIAVIWEDKVSDDPETPDETYSVSGYAREKTSDGTEVALPNAVVKLIGNGISIETITDENGYYAFENIPVGEYNIVISKIGGKTKTELVTVSSSNVELSVVLPAMNVSSVVTVETEVGSAVSSTIVGNLDAEAQLIAEQLTNGNTDNIVVEIDMKIDAQMTEEVDEEVKQNIDTVASQQSENLTFVDIQIIQTITTNNVPEKSNIHETQNLLKIVFPFDTEDRSEFAVYRYHEGLVGSIRDVQKITETANAYGEYIEVGDGVIAMHVRYFSTYAIGYSEGAAPSEYTVSFNANGGTGTMTDVIVTANTKYPLPVCTFTAPAGKEFKAWEINGVEYAVGAEITINKHVTVKAVWKNITTPPVEPEVPVIPTNPSYMVSVAGGMDGGKIEASSKSAAQGKTVTITVTPNKGYELETLTVTDNKGNAVALTSIGGGKYTFVMPAGQVSISATFVKKDTSCSRDYTCPIWPYTDAKTTAWYHDGVHYCIENGLMNGLTTTQFAPNGTTTRAQIVTILWRLEGQPYANYAMSFSDVAAGQWYTEAVRWAAANGIVGGYSDTVFAPNDAITREQFAAILWRYCQYKGIDVSVGEETNILSYTDAFDVHSWAMDAMQWACGAGVIGGIADGNSMKLDPTGSATRAQVATMLQRFCTEIMEP